MIQGRTRHAGIALALLSASLAALAAGCAGGYTAGSVQYASAPPPPGRPHPDYFCADCHGVLYFDPYYDVCLQNGYYFNWRRRPDVVASYRQSYVRIRETHPDAGRYRYPKRYREETRDRFADAKGRLPTYRRGVTRIPPESKVQKGPVRYPRKTDAKEDGEAAPREKDGGERGKKGKSSGSKGR
ncbi:MAG: hypothetical protein ACREOU_15525 [Candidatus Eiseniibacteriota bacterium]